MRWAISLTVEHLNMSHHVTASLQLLDVVCVGNRATPPNVSQALWTHYLSQAGDLTWIHNAMKQTLSWNSKLQLLFSITSCLFRFLVIRFFTFLPHNSISYGHMLNWFRKLAYTKYRRTAGDMDLHFQLGAGLMHRWSTGKKKQRTTYAVYQHVLSCTC